MKNEAYNKLSPEERKAYNQKRYAEWKASHPGEKKGGKPTPRAWWSKERKQKENKRKREKKQWRHMTEEQRSKWATKKEHHFIAVDGEAIGEWGYHLLAASNGRSVEVKGRALKPSECLEFLLSLGEKGKVVVGYGFGYDVENIVRGLPLRCLEELRDTHCTHTKLKGKPVRILYVPRKFLSISEHKGIPTSRRNIVRQVKVWDVHSFFACAFAKAIGNEGKQGWNVATAEELELIEEFKALRGEFTPEMATAIRDYNAMECSLLVRLMERLDQALLGAGLCLRSWQGPGAIAAQLMTEQRVKDHKAELPEPIREPVMRAYFGGRAQCLRIGLFEGVYNYDINSAYPATMITLPTLHGEWKWYSGYDPEEPWALWRVSWNVGPKSRNNKWPLTPFPWRDDSGDIHYPTYGEGWYWAPLVKVANEAWGYKRIRIEGGWVFHPANDDKPFGFFADLYERRLEFQRQGRSEQIALKLGMNSGYGKTAQSQGFNGSEAPFQSYVWAGLITADCQAKLLGAAVQYPRDVIAMATDGLFSSAEHKVNLAPGLGNWEMKQTARMGIWQPGLYAFWNEQGEISNQRARGVLNREVDFNAVADLWRREHGGYFFANRRYFIGHRLALARGKPETNCSWVDDAKKLHLFPGRGFSEELVSGTAIQGDNVRWFTWDVIDEGKYRAISAPFVGKKGIVEDRWLDIAEAEMIEECN